MSFVECFFLCRVFLPSTLPHGFVGGRPPTNPWGKPEGRKTRHKKKASTKLIVRGRKRGKATQ